MKRKAAGIGEDRMLDGEGVYESIVDVDWRIGG